MLFTTLIFCLISTVAGKGVHLIWSWQTGAVDMSAPTDSLVTVNLFPDFATCGATKPRTMYLKANKYSTLDSAKGLRVVRHDDGVKYNALRVYKGDECRGGWTLQPLGDACSDVGVFGSVMVVTDE